uniref:Uncharacterized protein n=1 Tax=Chromera velia CCMP2878 TaxID=1169474 RepID=A0A0G4HBD9_9ALVE|eukprot:Cvel_6202.t1-p1 / transcript=Cvel_6202.t1 / gene=Cvel_6202 / organism=Chromera_velia_CCMP2878 / gene_product=hypothetical protein / transcript_product=hypothetical protein / location=Cvel_scaffold300:58482-58718(-) / protein_length=79 / sequence_SO=supercontig / SO=protein_coding / is_pseudo=false
MTDLHRRKGEVGRSRLHNLDVPDQHGTAREHRHILRGREFDNSPQVTHSGGSEETEVVVTDFVGISVTLLANLHLQKEA